MTMGNTWTLNAVRELREMAREGLTLPVMSPKLKGAVAAKLAELGITPAASA